ncbi:hypothetical protein U3516DRAFT_747791 [Neocallimastix sp. 'constans']
MDINQQKNYNFSDDVDELDEFVDGESMGILPLVDNKEARCILKGYGENNLVNRSFLEKYILNHCIDDSSITGITKLTILNLTIGGVQKNVIFRVVEKENPFYNVCLNFKTQRELGIIIDPSDNLILLKQGTSEFRVVAELEKLSVLNKIINKNEENNNNNNNNIYNNNNNNNNKINNTKNDAVDDIINEKLNKLNALKLDNFRENNKLVNNSNSKCKTNNNIIITKEENKNNIKGSANIKKNQNNNIEINSIVIINNKENINQMSYNFDSIINRINKSITSGLVTEINIIDINNNTNIKERKINNNNSPVDFSNIIIVGCDKKIKINKIKKIIKIPYIYIQNNDKNKINIYKIMMPKPEIALNEIINYNNNRSDSCGNLPLNHDY